MPELSFAQTANLLGGLGEMNKLSVTHDEFAPLANNVGLDPSQVETIAALHVTTGPLGIGMHTQTIRES